jgi:SmpA / OmlA family
MNTVSRNTVIFWGKRSKASRIVIVIGIVFLLFTSPIWLTVTNLVYEDWKFRLPFDSLTWKESLTKESPEPVRLRMIDDLLRKHALVGMRRSEVISLLGTPPATGYFREYDFVYWLGPERGFFGIDSEWLAVKFDSENRVLKASVVSD